MKTPALILAAALLLVAALEPVGAQTLLPGEWSGTLSWCCARPGRPGVAAIDHRMDAIYSVTVTGDTIDVRGASPRRTPAMAFPSR